MDISSTLQTAGAASAPKPATSSGALSGIASDFETFLKMLTAQARYQDPLEPLDSAEYASQLAQFSSVEQQVKTNDLLTAMASQLGSANMMQFAGWIGMEARSATPVWFDGAPISVVPDIPALADSAILVVKDDRGHEVSRLAMPTDSEPLLWGGVGSDGAPMPSGLYRFEVESFANGELLDIRTAETFARVTEARLENGQTMLVLNGTANVLANEVTALRESQ